MLSDRLTLRVGLVVAAGATVLGALAVIVHLNRQRWQRRVAGEVSLLLARPPTAEPRDLPGLLPAPVARYRELAVGLRAPIGSLTLNHGGTFRLGAESAPRAIRGTQVFTADPPGFVWSARVSLAPAAWLVVRDMAVAGTGSMRVLFDATIPLVDIQGGPEIAQGSGLRLLAETVWYPTALFDERYVRWAAIVASHARATLRFGDLEVSGEFEFGADGLPLGVRARRYHDSGELLGWGGTHADWREVSGMLVPFEAKVTWQLDSGPFTYAHWRVDDMAYDHEVPFRWPRTACLNSAANAQRGHRGRAA